MYALSGFKREEGLLRGTISTLLIRILVFVFQLGLYPQRTIISGI